MCILCRFCKVLRLKCLVISERFLLPLVALVKLFCTSLTVFWMILILRGCLLNILGLCGKIFLWGLYVCCVLLCFLIWRGRIFLGRGGLLDLVFCRLWGLFLYLFLCIFSLLLLVCWWILWLVKLCWGNSICFLMLIFLVRMRIFSIILWFLCCLSCCFGSLWYLLFWFCNLERHIKHIERIGKIG